MTTKTLTEADVLDAAARIVAAYQATDASSYFAGFSPDADFIFHTEPEPFLDRLSYENAWADWVGSGWRVVHCLSSEPQVRLITGGAIFTHNVTTTSTQGDVESTYHERETIVFALTEDGLLAVHEHLSATPSSQN
ncbi:MAG TPA: DUF4440 domain-containing protein [Propionibacteriaceae bacterium]|nr:DUF4440 domain-containing protein [Propionibacteriaceae bacterium]